MKSFSRGVLALMLFVGSAALAAAQPVVSTSKSTYAPSEHVIVTYSGMPTVGTEVVAVSRAGDPDSVHPNMNFTNGRPSGEMDFDRLDPGQYEARLYFSPDNVVRGRHAFSVAAAGSGNQAPATGDDGAASDGSAHVDGEAASAGGPPAGYYECYFYGTYGLQGSSVTSIDILDGGRYRALGEVGGYSWDAGTNRLDLTGGALAGRVAHMKQSDDKPAIVFVRRRTRSGASPPSISAIPGAILSRAERLRSAVLGSARGW